MSTLLEAIRMEHPETIPVQVGILPAAWIRHGAEMQRLVDQYPQFFGGAQTDLNTLRDTLAPTYREGTWADEWGCVWEANVEGMSALVTGHPLKTEEDIFNLQIPPNRNGSIPHGFMYLRLMDLFGFENTMLLFAEEDEALRTLLDKVLEYNIYQISALLPHLGDLVFFGDDLGMQKGLAIGAEKWRKYLAPCFSKIFGIVKSYNPSKKIYMHTDGCIHEIMPDLVRCGVDMINPQFRANGIDNLVRVCRKEQIIPIDLDLDRQMFPFATRSQIFDHVAECVESLYLPEGGLGISIWFDQGDPLESIAAVLDAVEKYRHYKG